MNPFRRRFLIALPALAIVAASAGITLSLAPAPAVAATAPAPSAAGLDGKVVMSPSAERIVTVEPGSGDQISPGAVVHRSVIIQNRTKAPIDFDLDVAQVVGSTADLVVEVRDGVRGGAAAWVTLEKTTLHLTSGQQGAVGVTIRVPRHIKPGSKPFAVTATQHGGPAPTTGAGIAPQFRQVAIFILEFPGDAPVDGRLTKASITSAQKDLDASRNTSSAPQNSHLYVSPHWTDTHRLTLSTTYENKGERLLNPSGRVVIRDIFGRVAGRYEIPPFTVYPGGESAGTVELKGLPSLGVFTARVELESEAAGKQTTTLPRFVMIPKWFLLAAALFLLYGIYRLGRWQLRRRREWKRYLASDETHSQGDASGAEEWPYDEEVERA